MIVQYDSTASIPISDLFVTPPKKRHQGILTFNYLAKKTRILTGSQLVDYQTLRDFIYVFFCVLQSRYSIGFEAVLKLSSLFTSIGIYAYRGLIRVPFVSYRNDL